MLAHLPKSACSSMMTDASRPSTRRRKPSAVVTMGRNSIPSSSMASLTVGALRIASPRLPSADTRSWVPR